LPGLGVAAAFPRPLFAFPAYFGALASPSHHAASWALLALFAIFLPGLLMATAGLSAWSRLAGTRGFQGTAAGVNAAVVGVLAAALYNPVATTAIRGSADVLIVLAAAAVLTWRRYASLAVVALCVLAALVMGGALR